MHASEFTITHTLDQLSGVKRSKLFSAENGHIAYQVKGSETYNNIKAKVGLIPL